MKKKSITLLVSLLVLVCVTVGGTLAFLFDQTDPLPNTFAPSKVTTSVEETLEGQVKKNVSIKNTGDTTAYIRAAVIVTWQNEAGEVYGVAPVEGTDYSIIWKIGAGDAWFKGSDGFYYHKAAVAANGLTSVLFTDCMLNPGATAPAEGYYLNVEIIGSGIQSTPAEAVEEAWTAVEVADGKLQAVANG